MTALPRIERICRLSLAALWAYQGLVYRRAAWPYAVSTAAVVGLFLFVALVAPEHLGTPFNAVAVIGAWLVLGVVGWMALSATQRGRMRDAKGLTM